MKIGIMGTRGIPNRYGGFEQFAAILSQGLFQRGHDIYVYNSSLHEYREPVWNGVKIVHCRDREDSLGTAGQFIYDRNCIRDARKRNFDVLLHLGYTSDSIWHGQWPKESLNVVNMDGLEWKRRKYGWLTRQFLKRAEALAACHADVLVADNPAIRDYLQKKYNKDPVYIPYPVNAVNAPREGLPTNAYYLVIARMEPENHIETIIRGFLKAQSRHELVIVGSTSNGYGKYVRKKYSNTRIRFTGPIYDQPELDSLRLNARAYFHGHSVGGTNPSLLEAMACGCHIAAHDNEFNKEILKDKGLYFLNEDDVAAIIARPGEWPKQEYDMEDFRADKIVSSYEEVFIKYCSGKRGNNPEHT